MVVRRLHRDERGIILGFFLKLFLVLAIGGIVVADGASIFYAKLRSSDAAAVAATACAVAYKRERSVELAVSRALDAAEEKSPGVVVTAVTPDRTSGNCTVSVRDDAATLVIEKVGFLKRYGTVTATETANRPA